MKRQLATGAAIVAVVAGVGWNLASHPDRSASLQDVSLVPQSEHARPGPTDALAGIRIRLSPSDFDGARSTEARRVPQIAVAAQ